MTAAAGIEAVLFDLHGVVTSSPWSALAEVGAAGGHDEETVLGILLGDYTDDTDHPWHRLERGEIALGEWVTAVNELAAAAGVTLDFNRLRGFSDRILVNGAVVDRIVRLRRDGVKTALVTNNVREMSSPASGWRRLLPVPVDELFDAVVDSSAVGMRKPNPAIFTLALERLGGVAPERAVFLDDAPGNVEGARRAGLHTILVSPDDVAAALAELDALFARAAGPG